jgi:hypothetical protein
MTTIHLNAEDYSTLIIIDFIADLVSVIATPRHRALAYNLTHDEFVEVVQPRCESRRSLGMPIPR